MIHTIDLTDAIPAGMTILPSVIARAIPDIVEAMRTEIVNLAGQRLGTSTEDYVSGLLPARYHLPPGGRLPPGESLVASLELVGWLPNAVENGWAGGDMKPFLLAGRNAKTTKKGLRYNTVPFRHGTPGTGGRNFPAMGSAYQSHTVGTGGLTQVGTMNAEDAARLGRAVHKAVKKLTATTSHSEGGTSWGSRLPEGVGGAGLLKPHHKSDIYSGMVRQEKTYANAKQNQYTTFRRVSEKSDPKAFVHPGIEGRHLFREGAEYAGRAASFLLRRAVEGAIKGSKG